MTLTLTLEVYYQEIHFVIPHASELLAYCGRMPRAHERWKHCQMDPWSPSVLAPQLFIGTICSLSMSDINTYIGRIPMVVRYCLCSHSSYFGGITPFTYHVVQ